MEVHHHSHTARKKWTHYFWEFLMLFLAVTAGFFMENQREHFIEHQRARVLAKSLLEDIKQDTISLQRSVAFSKIKIESIDKLIALMHQPLENWNDSSYYASFTYIIRVGPFVRTQGTYEQIKNSGALRYFPQRLVGLLNNYDAYSKKAEDRDAVNSKLISEIYFPLTAKFVNYGVIDDILNNRPITHTMYNKIKNRDTVDEFINYAVVSKSGADRAIILYVELQKLADGIFEELKKQYNLE